MSLPLGEVISKPGHLAVLRSSKAKRGEKEESEGWPQPVQGGHRRSSGRSMGMARALSVHCEMAMRSSEIRRDG